MVYEPLYYDLQKWRAYALLGLFISYCSLVFLYFGGVFNKATRRIFAFTRALCLGETLVFLDVVSQGFIL